MIPVTCQFDTGNFRINVSGNLNDEHVKRFATNGFRWDMQREVATKVYLEVGGETVEGKDGEAKKRLPKGFERSSIEYSDETATQFRDATENALSDYGDFEVSVEKYEGAEATSPMKRATTLVDQFLGTANEAAWRGVLGLPSGSREELIAEANKRGLGVQPPRQAKA